MPRNYKNESAVVRGNASHPDVKKTNIGAVVIFLIVTSAVWYILVYGLPFNPTTTNFTQPSVKTSQRSLEQDYFVRRKQAYIDYLSDKRPDVYIPIMKSLVEEGIRDHGPDNLDLGSVYFHLGMIQYEDGQHKVAEENFLRSLYIFDKHYGEGNHDSGMAYANLGHVQFSQGRYQDALSNYQQGYDDLTKLLGTERADMVQIKNMIEKTKAQIERKK